METRKTSISYSDYVKGIKFLNTDEQLTLLEIISARLKKSIDKGGHKKSIMELEGLALIFGKALMLRIMFIRRESHGISR